MSSVIPTSFNPKLTNTNELPRSNQPPQSQQNPHLYSNLSGRHPSQASGSSQGLSDVSVLTSSTENGTDFQQTGDRLFSRQHQSQQTLYSTDRLGMYQETYPESAVNLSLNTPRRINLVDEPPQIKITAPSDSDSSSDDSIDDSRGGHTRSDDSSTD